VASHDVPTVASHKILRAAKMAGWHVECLKRQERTILIGELTADQIDYMIGLEVVGRLGCHAGGRTYVVPISYAYDGNAIYAYSFDGLKLRMMRENPSVCFELDRVEAGGSWESVIVQGRFEELSGQEAVAAHSLLTNRFRQLGMPWLRTPPSATEQGWDRVHQWTFTEGSPVVYRIIPLEKSGRFEHV